MTRWKNPAMAAGGLLALATLALMAARPDGEHGRCVGMFLDPGPAGIGSRLPSSVPADANNLTVRGTVPCAGNVMAWSARGPCRVFEDGTVEFLASPMPPCPGGDYYVWIAFPR